MTTRPQKITFRSLAALAMGSHWRSTCCVVRLSLRKIAKYGKYEKDDDE
jgi:hypothetical protein